MVCAAARRASRHRACSPRALSLATDVSPEDDRRARVVQLAAHHNFIAQARHRIAETVERQRDRGVRSRDRRGNRCSRGGGRRGSRVLLHVQVALARVVDDARLLHLPVDDLIHRQVRHRLAPTRSLLALAAGVHWLTRAGDCRVGVRAAHQLMVDGRQVVRAASGARVDAERVADVGAATAKVRDTLTTGTARERENKERRGGVTVSGAAHEHE